MKKFSFLLVTGLLLFLAGTAPALGTTINFDDLTIGTDNAADQVGGRMTTWGSAPGENDDADIVANPASGGMGNAMFIAENDDLVLSLGTDTNVEGDTWRYVSPTTSGTVTLSFDLWVDDGNYAYWNIQSWDYPTNEWAVEIYYGYNNLAGLYVEWDDHQEADSFDSEGVVFDQWATVVQTLDLDNNTYALSIGGSQVLSLDSFDGLTYWDGLLGANLYGADANADYYVDNISFDLESTYSGAPVPEPGTMLLFGIGLLGLAGFTRKKP